GCLGCAVAAAISTVKPFHPTLHDEYSYLLGADTLLHGRLANPTPKAWEALQTFHVIMQPAYASKYPLAQSASIALGWWFLGIPLAGAWLGAGLASVSAVWMLAGVASRGWAILGGLIVAFHPAMQTAWSYSLAGGWLTFAASMMVLGGVLRLRRQNTEQAKLSAAVMGCGIGMMALSRPFEGLVFTLGALGLLLVSWISDDKPMNWDKVLRVGGIAGVPVALALLLTAAQNQATTGSVFTMPYQAHEASYGVAPLFVFGSVNSLDSEAWPTVMSRYHYGWSLQCFEERTGGLGWLRGIAVAAGVVVGFGGFSLTLLPAASLFWTGRHRFVMGVLAILGLQVAASATVCWVFPHYLAPLWACLLLVAVLGLRRLLSGFSRTVRVQILAGLLTLQVVQLGGAAYSLRTATDRDWAAERARVSERLMNMEGDHLVFVQYDSDHIVHQEWVYNTADLDSARIIWAHFEEGRWQAEVRQAYGRERSVWLLEVEENESLEAETVLRPLS
ncbi:MAG: hypothetical protein AB8B50_14340, partial [Pirellulaceae bacterium]